MGTGLEEILALKMGERDFGREEVALESSLSDFGSLGSCFDFGLELEFDGFVAADNYGL